MNNKLKKIFGGKHAVASTLVLALAGTAFADIPAPVVDPSSSYGPTKIINGTFDVRPFEAYKYNNTVYTSWPGTSPSGPDWQEVYPNGVDKGWNSTDIKIYQGGLFEYSTSPSTYGLTWSNGGFIEMNAYNSAVFSQDLTTIGGDVMLWTLKHAARRNAGDNPQQMKVEVGAPQTNATGVIIAATGIGNATDAKLQSASKVTYTVSGVTNPSGATYGYASSTGLAGLSVYMSGSTAQDAWKDSRGVYVIPEGQGVTRFAFTAIGMSNPGCGNLLDDITFSTLIGNLNAAANEDGSVTVKGYWGDTDASKHLCVKIDTVVYQLDMSGVLNKNFTVTIPAATIGEAAKIEVYHQDYEQAKRTVKIRHPHQFFVTVDGTALKAYCTNAAHTVELGCDHAGEVNAVVIGLSAKHAPYTGSPYTRVKLTGDTAEWVNVGLELPTFSYSGRDGTVYGPSEIAPTDAGYYTAKATSGTAFITSDFEIMKVTLGEFQLLNDGFVKASVKVDGAMTLYSVSVNGAKLRITAASGTGWKFKDAVKSVSSADPTPVVGTDYLSISLIIDKSAIGSRTVAEVAEEALMTLRYTKAVAEVKVSGTYLGEGITFHEGDYFLNGHFYTLSSGCQTWNAAMVWAFNLMTTDATRYPGYKSYPVTITSLEENQLLVNIWNNAHPEYVKGTEVWLPSVPKNITGGTITIGGTEGARTVTVTGVPLATENDGWTRPNGCYGMGERYVWMTGVPEAGLPLPAETNSPSANGVYWSMTNPSNRGVNYFGHPNIGAVWDDLAPASYGGNAWTSFSNDGTFHMYGLAEWEPKDPETVVTVSDTAKMVPVTFRSESENTMVGGAAFTSTNTVRKVGSLASIPTLMKSDVAFLGWTTVSGGSPVVEKTSEQIAAINPAIGTAEVTYYAVWSDALTLGEFVPLTRQFPEVVGTTGNKYPQLTIMLTREMSGEVVSLPNVPGYTKNTGLSTEYSYVIDISPAKTVAEIATNYLAKVKFLHIVNQEVRVVLGPSANCKTFFNIDTGHYYQYVSFDWQHNALSWTTCYDRAKGMAYAGRRGYLATVTSLQEDSFIYGAANEVGWLAGTHMKPTTRNGQYYDGFTPSQSLDHWYWACGPECGEEFFDNQKAANTTYSGNAAKGYYFNWETGGEPNGGTASENCLTTLRSGNGYSTSSTIANYSWNDSQYNRNDGWETYMPKGYFIEYGDRRIGDSSDDDPSVASLGGYVIATADIVAPLVAFNAWGGYFGDDRTWEVASNICVDGVYMLLPASALTRDGYDFAGWFASWTNGAAQANADAPMFVQGPHMVYAKWISKSTPEGQGEKTIDFELAGNGAVLKGATNKLANTNLAVPEFTKNAADGVPYVIIKTGAFNRENYDRIRELELRQAGVPKAKATTNNLSSVTISTYVTNIQTMAFSGCESLTNVTFTKTRNYETGAQALLCVDSWAFQDSSVKSVVFPADSKVELKYGAFADATSLEDIYFLGDIELKAKYPFAGAGTKTAGKKVTIHLSAKLAADPAFVAALTNGMNAARLTVDQGVAGEIIPQSISPTPAANTEITLTFKVPEESLWTNVTTNSLYGFYATTPQHLVVGTGTVLKPTTLSAPDADGVYTATFTLPSDATSGFFKFCIGAER